MNKDRCSFCIYRNSNICAVTKAKEKNKGRICDNFRLDFVTLSEEDQKNVQKAIISMEVEQ